MRVRDPGGGFAVVATDATESEGLHVFRTACGSGRVTTRVVRETTIRQWPRRVCTPANGGRVRGVPMTYAVRIARSNGRCMRLGAAGSVGNSVGHRR